MVSVIVPVYKVAQFLPRCMASLLAQTYRDLEIILVDDGSPDESGQICDCYAQKDSRIVVIHKENGGVSSARNAGLEVARGEYVGFVDSDDWVEPDMYEKLVHEAEKVGADAVFCGFHVTYDNSEKSYDIAPSKITGTVSRDTALSYIFGGVEMPCFESGPCNKIFKKSKIGEICFPEGITVAEDAIFVTQVLLNCEKIALISSPLYYYYMRDNSASHSSGLTKQTLDDVSSLARILQWIKPYREAYEALASRVFFKGVSVLASAYCESNQSVLLQYKKTLKDCVKIYSKSNQSFLRKGKYLVLYYMVLLHFPKKWVRIVGNIRQSNQAFKRGFA